MSNNENLKEPAISGSALNEGLGYGFHLTWNNGSDRVEITGCSSIEEAYKKAWDLAFLTGYTLPKFYQFWRWNDSVPNNY